MLIKNNYLTLTMLISEKFSSNDFMKFNSFFAPKSDYSVPNTFYLSADTSVLSQNRQTTLCLFKKVTLRFRFKSGGGLEEKFDDIIPNIKYKFVRIHTLKLSAEMTKLWCKKRIRPTYCDTKLIKKKWNNYQGVIFFALQDRGLSLSNYLI